MHATDDQQNPIDVLAEEFTARVRRGERPNVDEYATAHVALADEIRHLFPTILAMECAKRRLLKPDHERAMNVSTPDQLGDYRIVREIGRGGMGVVYEAEQKSLGRRVAVKVFPNQGANGEKHLRRFQREARTAARLHHTNIVQVFGAGEQDGLSYYVMQLIEGVGLDGVVDQLKGPLSESHVLSPETDVRDHTAADEGVEDDTFTAMQAANALLNGTFPPRASTSDGADASSGSGPPELSGASGRRISGTSKVDRPARYGTPRSSASLASLLPVAFERNYWQGVANLGVQVADALTYAHAQGTLHRDIKPANLLLDAQGTVWVTDFGLAKVVAQDQLSQTGDIVGTLRYMAPEQLTGTCDSRVDIYGLGLTLYELLTLHPAFGDVDRSRLMQKVAEGGPTPPRKLRPTIPHDLETIVLKAIARDPKYRFETAAEFSDDLRRFLADRPIRSRRVGSVERLWRWGRRNPAIASLSLVLLLVVAVAFAGISWNWRQAEKENRRAEANLSLALDSMNAILERLTSTPIAHPAAPDTEDDDGEFEFRMVVSSTTAAILQDALQFYDQFAEENAVNPRLRRDTAKAHQKIGDIRERLGQYGQAEIAYRLAVEILNDQRTRFPNDPDVAVSNATAYNHLGQVLHVVGRNNEACWFFYRAQGILDGVPDPSPKCRHELARTHTNLGDVLWRLRRFMEAGIHRKRAVELLEQLIAISAGDAPYRLALARAYRSYYLPSYFGGQRKEVHDYQVQAITILEGLVDDFPNVPDYQCELSETLSMTSGRLPDRVDTQQLEDQLRRAVDLAGRLVDEYPTIPRYRAALARSLRALGARLAKTDRGAEAEPLFAQVVTLYETLCSEFPSIHAYQWFLAMALHVHGDALRELDRLAESRERLERAISQQRLYLDNQPDRSFARGFLIHQHESLVATLRALGEQELADQHAAEASAMRAKLGPKYSPWRRGDKSRS